MDGHIFELCDAAFGLLYKDSRDESVKYARDGRAPGLGGAGCLDTKGIHYPGLPSSSWMKARQWRS